MSLFSKPEVKIYKESSDAKEYLKQLEELYARADGELKEKIQKDIKLARMGIEGEEKILFELKNSGMDMFVLHDIYIECGDLSAQIDFYVITPKIDFIIECKNLVGNIEINSKGEFIRTIEYGKKKYREGIYSPITQNERHLLVIKNKMMEEAGLLKRAGINTYFDVFHKSLVVLANPKTILNDRYAKKEIKEKVIRADQLIATMKRLCNESREIPARRTQMEEAAAKMLGRNIGRRKDYLEEYKSLLEEIEKEKESRTQILPKGNKAEKLEEIKVCPRCKSELVKRDGKYGEFWGCSRFPKCRYTEKVLCQSN